MQSKGAQQQQGCYPNLRGVSPLLYVLCANRASVYNHNSWLHAYCGQGGTFYSIAVLDLGIIRLLSHRANKNPTQCFCLSKTGICCCFCSNSSWLNVRGRTAACQRHWADWERDFVSLPLSPVVSVGIPIMQSFFCIPFSLFLGVQSQMKASIYHHGSFKYQILDEFTLSWPEAILWLQHFIIIKTCFSELN